MSPFRVCVEQVFMRVSDPSSLSGSTWLKITSFIYRHLNLVKYYWNKEHSKRDEKNGKLQTVLNESFEKVKLNYIRSSAYSAIVKHILHQCK